jgi:ParB family transcriptional regulator, chromosome partitioning protein
MFFRDGLEVKRESLGCPSWRSKMTKAGQKITLSPSRDIPFNKLVLSQSNVRRVKAGVSIEQLAESIAQRTLLQSLIVRAVVDAEGNETGMFEVPAGGRRYRALELLVKQKRMAKTQAVPCIIREGGIAEDDSLAENDERVGLHPLDQFRAFKTLSDAGLREEDIAARHFVSPAIVKQRLRLASVSPKLHEVYAEDGMTLEQLMAFSVTAVVVGQWEPHDGHYPVTAYQAAFAISVVLQLGALLWYALPWLRVFGKHLYLSFMRLPAECDSQTPFLTAPPGGGVLEVVDKIEW